MFDWTLAFGVVLTSSLVAVSSLLLVTALGLRSDMSVHSIFHNISASTVFLFDGQSLVDATPAARAYLRQAEALPSADQPWLQLLARMEPVFPGLALRLEDLPREGMFVLCSSGGSDPSLVLRAEAVGGLTRLTLVDSREEAAHPGSDGATEIALRAEIKALREMLALAPYPIWREASEGEVTWANATYLALAAESLEPGKEVGWPLPVLFSTTGQDPVLSDAPPGVPLRHHLRGSGIAQRWFDVMRLRADQVSLGYALPADQAVHAEIGLQDFRQTLSKIFAQLSIGLAIFDRARVLQTFNPALADITGLDPAFLVARPSMEALLDALRVDKKIPEPKDYRSWRRRISDIEATAASGSFEELWTLPGGDTWRVTGRPHPNGALAFVIEDVSSDTSRRHRYRADLDLGQAVMDKVEDPMVVFGQDGALVMANLAARDLWPDCVTPGATARGVGGVIMHWREMTAPSLFWNDLAGYIGSFGPRDPWEGELRFLDGRVVICLVIPLPQAGATLLRFQFKPPPLAQTDDPEAIYG